MRRLFVLLVLLCGAARADDIQVMIGGRSPRSMDAYRVGTTFYLTASDAGSLYQAEAYWRPMSGTVLLTLRGERVQLTADADKAQFGRRTISLDHPMIVRLGEPFIPIEFFASPEFSELSGYETRFRPESKVLMIERSVTVGPVEWFSFGERSQLVVPIQSPLSYEITRRGHAGLRIDVPFGRADASTRISIGDGLLQAVQIDQVPSFNPKAVRVTVELQPGVELWEKSEQSQPRRLVLNFFRNQRALDVFHAQPPSSGTPTRPAPAASAPPAAPLAPKNGVTVTPAPLPAAGTDSEAAPAPAPVVARRRRIVVDAGHGGKDRGTTGLHRTFEKDINLLVARDLAKKLQDSGRFEVLLTRKDDTFIPLGERSRLANNFRADLFVSLHCNSANHRNERGFEVYFLSEKASDPESQRVADVENAVLALEGKSAEQETAAMLLQAMAKTEFMNDAAELAGLMTKELPTKVDLKDRGVKQAAFYVLRGTNAPAVLVEMGFLSNAGDEARLATKRFRKSLVDGLYAGVLDFADRHHWKAQR